MRHNVIIEKAIHGDIIFSSAKENFNGGLSKLTLKSRQGWPIISQVSVHIISYTPSKRIASFCIIVTS